VTLTSGTVLDTGNCYVGNMRWDNANPTRPSAVRIAAASIWTRVISAAEAGDLHDNTSKPSDLSTGLVFNVELEDGEEGETPVSGTDLVETTGTYTATILANDALWYADGPML